MSGPDGHKAVAGRRGRRVRLAVRAVALVAAAAALVPFGGAHRWATAVQSASPFVAMPSLVATRTIAALGLLGIGVAVVALFRNRWFCRWACPTGLCADGAAKVGRRLGLRCPRVPAAGTWIALLTLGGACFGYPLLLWLDPLALFSAPFGVLRSGAPAAAWWGAAGIAFVLFVSAALPGAWCARLCPLGSLQDLLYGAGSYVRKRAARGRDAAAGAEGGVPRRIVLAGAAGLVWAGAVRRIRRSPHRPLRPPGAAGEDRFTGLCIRCGNCARVCPAGIIRPDIAGGVAGLLAPTLDFREDYCREDCTLCTEVCPSGALAPVRREDKPRAAIGIARVDMSLCLLGDDRECSVCRNRCPFGAIRLVFSEADYTLTPKIDPEKCPGCGACEAACPTAPRKAIIVVAR